MAGERNILLSVITQVTVSVVLLAVAGGIAAMLWHTRPQPAKINEPLRLRRVEVMKALAVPVRRQWQDQAAKEVMHLYFTAGAFHSKHPGGGVGVNCKIVLLA